jgi:ribosome biogenesis GTPase A
MLTGISRSGKSTLINILSEKLISLETPEFLSVTTEINEYIIYKEIKKDTIIKLKFIDTPGLIQEKDNDTTDKVIKSINIKLKEFEDTNDIIHIIYFFMPDNPNLEQSKKFFTYLNDLNTERIKKGLPKLPVLFIFNRNPSDYNHDSLKQFLRENNYNNLYEEKNKL